MCEGCCSLPVWGRAVFRVGSRYLGEIWMDTHVSREPVLAGLVANQWVELFRKENPTEDPVFYYRRTHFHISAHSGNGASVHIRIQESPTGLAGSWVTIFAVPTPVVPGGELDVTRYHTQRYIRVVLYSIAAGGVKAVVLTPEEQVIPNLIREEGGCVSWCEVDCETGLETTGAPEH